jgi:hypothetical protein
VVGEKSPRDLSVAGVNFEGILDVERKHPRPDGKGRRVLLSKGTFSDKMYESVQTLGYVSDHDYDRLLSENVVFLSLYDASASNAVVECMARNTPILINPLPAIVEYLGQEYPFYFTSLEEAAEKLTDLDLIRRAHTYLVVHPAKKRLTGTFF